MRTGAGIAVTIRAGPSPPLTCDQERLKSNPATMPVFQKGEHRL
jgi:hypothetical protein